MKRIALIGKYGEGKYALVDDVDYERLRHYRYYLTKPGYPMRGTGIDKTYLHNDIVGKTSRTMQCDHINRDKLDNRRSNLRLATPSENILNKPLGKGVTWHKGVRKWQVYCASKYIGLFSDRAEAMKVYQERRLSL